jgi:hypothetical protein
MLARLVEHKDIIIILMLHPRSIAIDIDDIRLPRHDSRGGATGHDVIEIHVAIFSEEVLKSYGVIIIGSRIITSLAMDALLVGIRVEGRRSWRLHESLWLGPEPGLGRGAQERDRRIVVVAE